ncbi:MAG: tetratricopeptide repeat protein [Candidatus Odinarchaeota archaeon]
MTTPQENSILQSRFLLAERKELACDLEKAQAIYDEIIVEYYYKDPLFTSRVTEAMFQKGLMYLKEGKLDNVSKQADLLLRFVDKRSYRVGIGQANYLLANAAVYQNNLVEGRKLAQKSLLIGEEISQTERQAKSQDEEKPGTKLLIRANALLGWINYLTGDTDQAIIDFMDAIVPAEQIVEKRLYYSTLNGIGKCYQDKGFHDKSFAYFEQAEMLAREKGDIELMTAAITNIAVERRYMGEYQKALEILLETLETRKKIDLRYTDVLKSIALIYYDIGEYQLSDEYFSSALAASESFQWLAERALILGDYARLNLAKGYFSRARELLEKSLEYYEETHIELGLVEKLCLYIEILVSLGNTDEAGKILKKATELADRHRSILEQQQCQLSRALLERSTENYGNARTILVELLEDAKDYEFFEIHINTCLALAELFLERWQWKQLSKDLKVAQNYIDQAEKLSKQANMVPKLLHTMIIKASLLSTNKEFTEAYDLLAAAKEISEEKKFVSLSKRIDEAIFQISDKRILSDQITSISPSSVRAQAIGEVLDQISHRKDYALLNEFDLDQFYVTVFKHDIYGPQVFITEDLPLRNTDEALMSIGVFYTTAIGQGNRHHQGLFGPLPVVDNEEFTSLIHARDHKDSGQKDAREKGKSYCLFCIFYHGKFASLFYNRENINAAFENVLITLDDLQHINPEFLRKLKKAIYAVIKGT